MQIFNLNKVKLNNIIIVLKIVFSQFKKLNNFNTLFHILLTKILKVHLDFCMCCLEHGQDIDMRH